jgi:FAD:protein FMN transferase
MMRETRLTMGMPVCVEVRETEAAHHIADVFSYFDAIDRQFSIYKADSEISAFNASTVSFAQLTPAMREVLAIAELTKAESDGHFDIMRPDGLVDPSGIVKGWAIRNAALRLRGEGCHNFFVDAGGDAQAEGVSDTGEPWRVGIRNPFDLQEVIKIVALRGQGIATSGTSARGQHIYNPLKPGAAIEDIVSLTVIGPDVLEADRFATAAFAMGADGIYFIEERPGMEAYMVDTQGLATQTTGFGAYVVS